ncbi:hypothetical protein SASPL_120135 [Salvia splendens]|uniref:Beta-galactosidase n=1 Tax=Salvia splendens TaxID=180675 RepID=A0A8X8XQ84_SALSN|nr:hypothetical protein SASPL_120135 [Salvia splendens]
MTAKAETKRFTAKIVDLMKQENLYASQGGPIILSQIENEYGNIDSAYGGGAKPYITWAATMATSLNTGVPWVMCQQKDAPNPIIDTCNGFYCDQYTPNSNNKPKMWTENWSGWFSSFGDPLPYRPTEDVAFAVARFYQLGGTFQNYYMYHGGTNFGRSSGGPFITTTYDYDAPIDEYGLLRQPKWGHLKDVHKAIKLCEEAMVETDPKTTSLGSNLEATVYKTESGKCAAFLANVGTQSDATVKFNGNSYSLAAWSVSILPDCKNVVLNTAKINSMSTVTKFVHQSSEDGATDTDAFSGWSWIYEPVGVSSNNAFTKPGLLEQINTTADQSDYLWYSLSIETKGDEPFLEDHVDSLGHALKVFLIPELWSIVRFERCWSYRASPIGLKGEGLGLSTGSSSLWVSRPALPKNQPLVWYKTTFDAPSGSSPVALDFTGLGKGEAWRILQLNQMSEKLYHVPRSWLKPSGNVLVLFEQEGGDPTKLSFATREVQSICSRVSDSHPIPVEMWTADEETRKRAGPTLSLGCLIHIRSYLRSTSPALELLMDHAGVSATADAAAKELSPLLKRIDVRVSVNTFGDPCAGTAKTLAVEASCAYFPASADPTSITNSATSTAVVPSSTAPGLPIPATTCGPDIKNIEEENQEERDSRCETRSKRQRFGHNALTYHVTIKKLGAAKMYEEMDCVVNPVLAVSSIASEPLYNSMIYYFTEARKLVRAVNIFKRILFKQMVDSGIEPDIFCLNSMIKGYVLSLHVNDALRIFHQMGTSYECQPNSFSYDYLIHGLCAQGRTQNAREICDRMKKSGFVPSSKSYTSLVNSLALEGEVDEAVKFLWEMAEHQRWADVITYRTVSTEMLRQRGTREALRFLYLLQEKKVVDGQTYQKIVYELEDNSHYENI